MVVSDLFIFCGFMAVKTDEFTCLFGCHMLELK
jgi:hypothetical protein